jgi:type IV pilus assembly protein PilB
VLEVNDSIRELILSGASAIELRQQSIEDGMITLRGSGRQKIRDGVTTIDEVMRETVN